MNKTVMAIHIDLQRWSAGLAHMIKIAKRSVKPIQPTNDSLILLTNKCSHRFHLKRPRSCNLEPKTNNADPHAIVTTVARIIRSKDPNDPADSTVVGTVFMISLATNGMATGADPNFYNWNAIGDS